MADVDSDIAQANGIEDPEYPEQRDLSAVPDIRRLIQPTRKSQRQPVKVSLTVNAIETRRNMRVKKK